MYVPRVGMGRCTKMVCIPPTRDGYLAPRLAIAVPDWPWLSLTGGPWQPCAFPVTGRVHVAGSGYGANVSTNMNGAAPRSQF